MLLIGWNFDSTDQKHYPDLGSSTTSVWNFCARFSDVISRGNFWWRHEMLAVFSKYPLEMLIFLILIKRKVLIVFKWHDFNFNACSNFSKLSQCLDRLKFYKKELTNTVHLEESARSFNLKAAIQRVDYWNEVLLRPRFKKSWNLQINAFLVYAICFHEIINDKRRLDIIAGLANWWNELECGTRGIVKHMLNSLNNRPRIIQLIEDLNRWNAQA